jgi:Protein of unknown function (DUF3866)
VLVVRRDRPDALELEVEVEGERAAAVAFPTLTGPIREGATVVLNTTAVALGLGTGGVHFVVAVEGGNDTDLDVSTGRLMKARYTPLQTAVRSVEETDADLLERSNGLAGIPVAVAPLHSMIGPVAAGARAAGASRVAYVMTDGAALPGAFSRLVHQLRERGVLAGFVTCGQAFGGDLETATLWTGLLAAREILGADAIVVADGPGNLGTATKWGVSALGAGHSMNAAASLGGRPVAALRVSFADSRARHRSVSHHSITILSDVCLVRADVAVPLLEGTQREQVWASLREARLEERYRLVEVDGGPALEAMVDHGVEVRSMGRTAHDDSAFFLAAGAAGILAGQMAAGHRA